MSLPGPLQEILDDLKLFPSRAERIDALIGWGDEFVNPGADQLPRDEFRKVPGCESEVYVMSEPEGEGRRYLFAVDNPQGISAMALARILQVGLNGLPDAEVQKVPDDIIFEIFGNELSMGKSLGLMGMVRMTKIESAKRNSV
jgi:cysteine desulfuration protein SufE